MGTFWQKLGSRVRTGLLALLLLYILIFIIMNWNQQTRFWIWFGNERPTDEPASGHHLFELLGWPTGTTTLRLSFLAFVAGSIVTLLTQKTVRTYRNIRDSRQRTRQDRLVREVEEMKAKAAMLVMRPGEGSAAPSQVEIRPPLSAGSSVEAAGVLSAGSPLPDDNVGKT